PKMVAEIESEDGEKVSQILAPKSRFIQPNENANFSTIIPLNENVFSSLKGRVSVFFYDGEGILKTVQVPFEVRAQ
ncbi:MAG: hypothetical protein HY610_01320, partial [Elusimicrobia bacterium]|nr:hypothetical protein [Elusimicrobiota bacterium]